MALPLGSSTSGVDGSSEGGRINTSRLNNVLVLYGVALVSNLRARGYKGRLDVEPALTDGAWRLKLRYTGDKPRNVPATWHGHRVMVEAEKQRNA